MLPRSLFHVFSLQLGHGPGLAVFIVSILLAFGAPRLVAAEAAELPPPTLYNISVTYPLDDRPVGLGGWVPGTSLHIVVRAPQQEIIGIDSQRSKLYRFADDVGTNLLEPGRGRAPLISPYVTCNKEKTAAVVQIQTGATPAPGAKSLELKAGVVVQFGVGAKEAVLEGFKLEVGQTGKVGSIDVAITEFLGRTQLTFTHEQNILKSFVATDQNGKPLQEIGGHGFLQENGKTLLRKNLVVLPGMTSANIKAITYESIETATVPVELEFSLGGTVKKQAER